MDITLNGASYNMQLLLEHVTFSKTQGPRGMHIALFVGIAELVRKTCIHSQALQAEVHRSPFLMDLN